MKKHNFAKVFAKKKSARLGEWPTRLGERNDGKI